MKMTLEKLPSEFQKALPILEKIKSAGFEAYFVGGSVRDVLLQRPIHDVDIATSSYPQETKAIFERTVDVGIEHGTVLVLENGEEYEITTFRTEEAYVDYRRPSRVNFVRSLEEDLKRRDFTVNAFALDEKGQLIDLFDGIKDLKSQTLRAVGQAEARFTEDALRIMRGFRFAAVLDFSIEPATFTAMQTHAPLLSKISVERSFIEFDRLLLADFWQKGLRLLLESGACDYLPGLVGQADKLAQLLSQSSCDFTFSNSAQAWAYLLLALEVDEVPAFLKRWKTSTQFQKTVDKIVSAYRKRSQQKLTRKDCYFYGADILKWAEQLRSAQGLDVDMAHIDDLDRSLVIHDKHEIVVNGGLLMKALNIKAGPGLGELLKQVELAIVEGRLANEKEAIIRFVKERLHP